MRPNMLNEAFDPSHHWSIPDVILYVMLGLIGASLLFHAILLLIRHYKNLERYEIRYERLLNSFGTTPAEKICLDHCSTELGIKDKAQLLTDRVEFDQVLKWAEQKPDRRMTVYRLRLKLDTHDWRPPKQSQRKVAVGRSSPVARTV